MAVHGVSVLAYVYTCVCVLCANWPRSSLLSYATSISISFASRDSHSGQVILAFRDGNSHLMTNGPSEGVRMTIGGSCTTAG